MTRPRRAHRDRGFSPAAASPASPRRRGLGRLVAVNLLVLASLFVLVEAGARVAAPRDLRSVFNDPQVFIRQRPFVTPHAERGFALVPGYEQGTIRVNAAGFRGDDLPADLDRRRVLLALGESSTFGWGVADGEDYPTQIHAILDERGYGPSTWVINAGVPSYTSSQVRAYLEELLTRYRPRAVVVSVLWNDALFACIPNWMPEYLAAQQPSAWRQRLLRYSGLYRALAIDPPGAPTSGPVDNEPALDLYAENLQAISGACRRAGVLLLLLRPSVDPARIPAEGMKIWRRVVAPSDFVALLDRFVERLESTAEQEGVPVVRHRLCRADSTLSPYFIDPVHLNRVGNRMLAEDVLRALASEAGMEIAQEDARP